MDTIALLFAALTAAPFFTIASMLAVREASAAARGHGCGYVSPVESAAQSSYAQRAQLATRPDSVPVGVAFANAYPDTLRMALTLTRKDYAMTTVTECVGAYYALRHSPADTYVNADAIAAMLGDAPPEVTAILPVSTHRDADAYTESNHDVALRMLESANPDGTHYATVRFTCSMRGWVDHIVIDTRDAATRDAAADILRKLDAYPLLDERDACERAADCAHCGGDGIIPCIMPGGRAYIDCDACDGTGRA